jgi:hypothetical protein
VWALRGFAQITNLVRGLALRVLVDDPKDFVHKTMVLTVIEYATGIRVDFIFSYSPYEQQASARAREVQFGATTVNFASLEDVVTHKINLKNTAIFLGSICPN